MEKQILLAGCIITNQNKEVLLLHRHTPKRRQWEIPGGKIEPGESEAETAVREIQEELGMTVRLIRRLGACQFSEGAFTMHYTWFQSEITSGQPQIREPATFDNLRYVSRAAMTAGRTELSANTQNFLDAWLAGDFTLAID